MKIALLPAVVAIAWIGLVADRPAMAQNGPVATAAEPIAAPAGVPAASQGQGASPAATPAPAASDPTLIDNGLWGDAPVAPGCAICGGGCCCPPDWYTFQGTRIISHSNLRKFPIASQAPPQGDYAAIADSTGTRFNVLNDRSTIFAASNGSLLESQNNPSEVLNSKDFGLGIAAGYDMTIGHYFCRDGNNNDHFVEFTFWGLNSWSRLKSATGYLVPVYDESQVYDATTAQLINQGSAVPLQTGKFRGSLQTPYPMSRPELDDPTDQQKTLSLALNNGLEDDIYYRSTMNNFEINGRFSPRGDPDRLVLHPDGRWQRQCQPGTYMSYLYGIRFMEIDETFDLHTFSQGQWGDDWTLATQHAVGDYNINTHNSLLGFQIGADMTFRQCRWSWGIESKVGPYLNIANQTSYISANTLDGTPRPGFDDRLTANRYQSAVIGEVNFVASYKFRPNLMGRASYDFMWVAGVALAPEQLQFAANPPNAITTNGSIFAQGVTVGLEWMW